MVVAEDADGNWKAMTKFQYEAGPLVMSALMALHGIDHQEVMDAAHEKAARRGQFETGAWLTSAD